jgi:hypothetical protein
LERAFKVAEILDGKASLVVNSGILTQEVALRSNEEVRRKSFRQVDRPKFSRLFKQGHPGIQRVESFNQAGLGALDLLIVVDNSGSMAEEQDNLAGRLVPLLEYFKKSDWRINVVTTDPRDGCSRAVIRKDDPDLENRFRTAIIAGTSGSSNEQGIRMAVEGLACSQANWLRPNSSIGVLFVSDEDNCGNNGSQCDAPYDSPDYLLNYLKNDLHRSLGTEARVYGLIWKPGTGCRGALYPGRQYDVAIHETKGTWGSICDPDFTPTLLRMSQDLAGILKRDFTLGAVPDAGTVAVKVNGMPWSGGFTVTQNLIRFDPMPPRDALIEIFYQTGSTPLLSRFPLGERPAPGSIQVQVNGQRILPEDYTYEESSRELIFRSPPPFDADLAIEFRQDAPLLHRFPLDQGISVDGLFVSVNGSPLTEGYRVDGRGDLVFEVPPSDGMAVEAIYRVRTSPILEYALGQVGPDVRLLSVMDIESGHNVRASLRQNLLVIDRGEHREGRRVAVKTQATRSGHMEVPLSPGYIPNSAQFAIDQGTCSAAIQGLKMILDCQVPSEATVHVLWKHYTPSRSEFIMTDIRDGDQGLWKVFVDGRPTTNFVRRGSMIRVLAPLEPTSIVVIQFQPNP